MPQFSPTSTIARARRLRSNPTPAEAIFWQIVRKRRIGGLRFLRQFVITHDGEHTSNRNYIIDFYCPALRLCIEIDGGVHEDEEQQAYDEARQAYLEGQGYVVLRFSNETVLSEPVQVKTFLREFALRRAAA